MTEPKLEMERFDRKELWRIKKNVVVITVAFMIHFTASFSAGNLQSSVNAEEGLGAMSLIAMTVGLIFSNMFLTSIVIKYFSTKWTVFCGFLSYVTFIIFQLHPKFNFLIPSAFFMGVGAATLLCAKGTYVSVLAEAHSEISKVPASKVLLSFSGFFFMVLHMSQFWGNLISSLVLSSSNNASETLVNATMIPQICGSNFLPDLDAAKALPAQPFDKILTLVLIYLVFISIACVLIAIGLDPIERYEYCRKEAKPRQSVFTLVAVTMKHLTDRNQQLVLAINIFIGLQQAFVAADFTASYVACAIGTGSVGYVMMTYGASNVVGCLVNAYLAKLFGRLPLMFCALFIHGGLFISMLVWRPEADSYYIMVAIASLWGISDSIWVVQINTYYGVLFRGREEAAYSNLGLWESVGNIISFSLSTHVRTRYKIYLLLCTLILGITGYLTVEYREHRKESKESELICKTVKRSPNEVKSEDELEKLTI